MLMTWLLVHERAMTIGDHKGERWQSCNLNLQRSSSRTTCLLVDDAEQTIFFAFSVSCTCLNVFYWFVSSVCFLSNVGSCVCCVEVYSAWFINLSSLPLSLSVPLQVEAPEENDLLPSPLSWWLVPQSGENKNTKNPLRIIENRVQAIQDQVETKVQINPKVLWHCIDY